MSSPAAKARRPYHSDPLVRLERSGTISVEMRIAGEDFRTLFARAAFSSLRVRDLAQAPSGDHRGILERDAIARERLERALRSVGGAGSPAGSCLVHVVGEEMSLKDWSDLARRQGIKLNQEQASGVLAAALGVLAARYVSPS